MKDQASRGSSKTRRNSQPSSITTFAQESTYGQGSGRRRQKKINKVIKQTAKRTGAEGPKRSVPVKKKK